MLPSETDRNKGNLSERIFQVFTATMRLARTEKAILARPLCEFLRERDTSWTRNPNELSLLASISRLAIDPTCPYSPRNPLTS